MSKSIEATLATLVWLVVFFGGLVAITRVNGWLMTLAIGLFIGLMISVASALLRRYNAFGMMRND